MNRAQRTVYVEDLVELKDRIEKATGDKVVFLQIEYNRIRRKVVSLYRKATKMPGKVAEPGRPVDNITSATGMV